MRCRPPEVAAPPPGRAGETSQGGRLQSGSEARGLETTFVARPQDGLHPVAVNLTKHLFCPFDVQRCGFVG